MSAVRRPIVALSAMIVLLAVQALLDPTGLLALVGFSGASPSPDAGLWSFAPFFVFLPVLLGVTWWVALRAGDRYWTLVPGLVLAVLLAQAAACLAMVGDLATAGWAAGYVTAKAVPAALLVAAVARWLGGPGDRTRGPVGAVWLPAISLGLAAPLVSGLWWTGVAYAPGLPVPRADRGPVSVLVAMALLTALAVLALRWMRPRVRGLLGGWLAALVAGGSFGLVQAAVALVLDGGLTGELWPAMAAYVMVADGLAFGAGVGWIVGIAVVLVDRVGARRSAGSLRLAAGIAVVAAVATGVGLPAIHAVGDAAADAATDVPAGFLRAEGDIITDGAGNQVLLRGVNINQLVDFYQPRGDVPATRPLTEDDFAGMAAQGFDVVRLGFSWSALEPERGRLDDAYLDRISEAVAWARAHDLRVVLDMHQDGWWAGQTPDGTACRPGTDPMWGYDGAPLWATITDGAPRCAFTGRDISPAGDRAFQNFYFDRDGVQTAFVKTWGVLAGRFADEPAVAGFDLLNEPGFGETAPVTTSYLLGRLYDRAIREIRTAGAPQIVFVEPSILWSGLGFDSGPAPGFTDDANIVFSPHLYAESITMDRSLGLPPIVGTERQFDLAARLAEAYGVPLWSGEYGYWGEDADRVARLERYAAAEDANALGSAYWVWKQACGDPQNGIGEVGDGLQRQDCATGGDGPPHDDLLGILSRAYPRSAPGRVTELDADGATFRLEGTTPVRSCGPEVWLPGAVEPVVEGTGVDHLATTAVDGGWLVTGCAQGDYSLASS